MSRGRPERPDLGRGIASRRGFWVFVACALVAACTGENIFPTGVVGGSGGEGGDGVEITAPENDASVPVSDSVDVTADITAQNGVNQVSFTHTFPTGTSQRSVTLGAPFQDSTLTRTLWTGNSVGDGTIVVLATDVLGNNYADTISVQIN